MTQNNTTTGPGCLQEDAPVSVAILNECVELQLRKSRDYQNPSSTVVQADYYPSGVKTILEIMHAKMLRAKSLIEAFEASPSAAPNFESIEDTFKDLINYGSFAASWCRDGIPGQNTNNDILNRPLEKSIIKSPEPTY